MPNLIPSISSSPSVFTAEGRALARQVREASAETVLSGLKVKGIDAVTALSMACIADLDAKRRLEAGSNQVVNELCLELELTAARRMGRVVSDLFSDRGF